MAVCQNQPVILDYETGAAADFDSAAFVQHFRRYFFTNRRLQTERNAEKGKETPNFLFQLVLGFTDDDADHSRNYFFDYFDDWRFFHKIFYIVIWKFMFDFIHYNMIFGFAKILK